MKTLALALLTLSGCCGLNTVTDMPPEEADKAIQAWQDKGLPWNDHCYDQQSQLTVAVTDKPCPHSADEACFAYTNLGTIPTIFVRAETERDPEYIWQHELRHWLTMCTGLDHTGDPKHDNCQVWPDLCYTLNGP